MKMTGLLVGSFILLLSFILSSPAIADPFADSVVSFTAGDYLFGSTAPAPGDEKKALGAPDGLNIPLGLGGEIILRFVDNVIIDGPGDDLQINVFLPDSGSRDLDNKAQVLVSVDGISFTPFPSFIGPGGPSFFLDLSTIGFIEARFVKIVDSDQCCLSGNPQGGGDGFNVESVQAINSATRPYIAYYGLGDSVASGYGLPDDDLSDCRRSPAAYPRLVATALSLDFNVLDQGTTLPTPLACGGATSKDLENQIDVVLGDLLALRRQDPTIKALVSITIGADDFKWSDLHELGRHLCSSDGAFKAWVNKVTSGVTRNLKQQLERLINQEEGIYIVVTDYHNPFNTASNILALFFLPLPGNLFFQSACIKNPERIFQLQDRVEKGIQSLNKALKQALTSFPTDRVLITCMDTDCIQGIHDKFREHESPRYISGLPGVSICGTNLPDEADTWIQFPDGGLPVDPGNDCFHPNTEGARQYAITVEEIARQLLP